MPDTIPYTEPDRLIQDFTSRGLVILSPDSLGVSPDIHDRIYQQEKAAYHAKKPVTPSSIPDVLEILNAPGLLSACDQLVGKNWAIVPFTHNASFTSGGRDQHWHKDDNGPYNSRKQRHHQAVQVEMLYYPQAVTPQMGPTATIPYSQYWTYNHEENHDNFAGADHLDFAYHLSGMERKMVSGPDSEYDVDDIRNARTDHDVRMREAVTDTGWPLVKQLEAAPLEAGSILIYSHNTYHRGNHRRDDWNTWRDNPRFMWRFWLYRTSDAGEAAYKEPTWSGIDQLTDVDLSDASDDLTEIWRYHDCWIRTGREPEPRQTSAETRRSDGERLYKQLHEKGEEAEPVRIGAAYKLASLGDNALATELLGKALYTERESVRRAATYGLIAVGPDATNTFLEAARSPVKWVRKAGVYGLGDASLLTAETFEAANNAMMNEDSVYIRSVAAGTLGCLGRRAIARNEGIDLIPGCVEALLASLAKEENRVAMDIAQGRSIKMVRPTDDCDVCEGNGIDFGRDRFSRVRSAVRENALWSLVILSSHGAEALGDTLSPTVETLRKIVREDENVISVGFALDALTRLAHIAPDSKTDDLRAELTDILGESPVRAWESLVRGGLDTATLASFT